MFNEQEIFFTCPYCFQKISMVIETIYEKQSYIEDCEVCCQPIQLSYSVSEGEEPIVHAEAAQ